MQITIAQTKEQIDEWFKQNDHKDIIFDTETLPIDDDKPEWDQLAIESLCLYSGTNVLYVKSHLVQHLIPHFFDIQTLIAHNIVFDLKVLYKTGFFNDWFKDRFNQVNLYDTMVAQHLLDENLKSIGLKELAEKILHKTNVVHWGDANKFKRDSKEWIDYCVNDVLWCKELMDYQKPLLEKEGVNHLFYNIEMPFLKSIFDMEVNGILVDREKAEKIKIGLTLEANNLVKDMLNYLGISYETQNSLDGTFTIKSPINFNSSQQLGEIMFKRLKLPIIEYTPANKPSVGAFTIEKLKDKNKFVAMLHRYKICQKLVSGFLEPLPTHICKDGRIRPHFFDVGTVTGRLSSSKPNCQQWPRVDKKNEINVRDCLVASKGEKIFTCDFSGQEIRVMAELSRDPTLVDALNKGKDLHLTIANQFFNLGIPEESLFETDVHYKIYKDKYKEERTKAKVITFGLSYGKTSFGFAKDFNISEQEAQALVDRYFNGMPLLSKAIQDSHLHLTTHGWVSTKLGRKRRFTRTLVGNIPMFSSHDYRQCFNFQVQSLSADMMRLATNNVRKRALEHPEYGIKLLASIHDELVISGNELFINEIRILLKESFENSIKLVVSLPVEVGIGNSYGEAK